MGERFSAPLPLESPPRPQSPHFSYGLREYNVDIANLCLRGDAEKGAQLYRRGRDKEPSLGRLCLLVEVKRPQIPPLLRLFFRTRAAMRHT